MGHVSEFEKVHLVSGISDFVAYDYMSSEDDGPGFAWDAGETSTHGQFHGFQENTNIDKPKCHVPRSVLDEAWMVASGNQNIILEVIEIEDCKLDQEDLAALKEWREWDSQANQVNVTSIDEA
ncbi:uncharacterized protein LACBIDRAFT_330997 [Laccaria bicolor S238N-H82]|uniref:Predicted protein n=1 Tax=Laccaria bicolor (strain S238N-H82 / ATCC MYA-4686) TaxID=486041 RepID=B0DMX8_LACBS|nr:uncharacterized protein LACBIDRAFT_330997 [Laccaria bicolor S238N-H82]EDR04127.1 predicted protein [Laccaria bicolor S238N-H82]|eukprot:XP_001885382.1 predicted protein [Laccaria bicolor S238N-H82]